MSSNYPKFREIIRQKLFKIINILIDLIYGIFHYFVKHENWCIRYASAVEIISAVIFNTLDVFQIHCNLCSKKNSVEFKLNEEEINDEVVKKIEILQIEKEALAFSFGYIKFIYIGSSNIINC